MLKFDCPTPTPKRTRTTPLGFIKRAAALVLAIAMGAAVPVVAQAQEKPLYGGTMIVGLANEPAHLNIALTTNLSESVVTSNIYNKLLKLGINEEFLPELARSWDVSEDGRVYTFHLAENVKWHDGVPFTSADVKFSLESLTKEFHPNGAELKVVQSFETPDDNTLVMTLANPSEPLIVYLGLRAYILPKHIYEGTDVRNNPANTKPIGTGPYIFQEWERGSHITLTKNENYFLEGQPYLDQFIYRFIPDGAARVLALQTGEVDYVTHEVPATAIEELRKDPNLVVTNAGVSSIISITQLMLNLDNEPLKDLKVRQAINHAIDRDFMADRASIGLFKPSYGPIHSATAWAYTDDVTIYPYDVAKANALLDEAGYPRDANGVRFSMEILATRGREENVRGAEIATQMLREVGINATLGLYDNAALGEVSYVNRKFDGMVNGMTTGPDPAVGVQRQYVTSNIRPVPFSNAAGYSNEEVDKLFAAASVAITREERAELYREIQKILTADAAVIWLWEVTPYTVYSAKFAGVHDRSSASPYALSEAWSTEGEAR